MTISRPALTSPGMVLPSFALSKPLADYLVALEGDTNADALAAIDARVAALEAGESVTYTGSSSITVFGSGQIAISATYAGQTSLAVLGTVTVGTWNASVIDVPYGGTGLSSYAVGDLLYAATTSTLAALSPDTAGYLLTDNGPGVAPSWQPAPSSGIGSLVVGAQWVSTLEIDAASAPVVVRPLSFAGTIVAVRIYAQGGTGSCVVNIKKGDYAGYATASGICAAAKPTVSSGIKSEDTTLTGWTTAFSAGDFFEFTVESSSVFTRILCVLEVVPT